MKVWQGWQIIALAAWLPAAGTGCRVTSPPADAGDAEARDGVGDADAFSGETAVLPDAPGACRTDDDCVFRLESDCCGACLAGRDPPPPRRACGIICPETPPPCLCQQGRCRTGTLPRNAGCDPARDLCGRSLKCCHVCGTAAGPDGSTPCTNPICTTPNPTLSGPLCPVPGT